jgi:DNA (cytosine-5)-methyltransferase 1
MTPPQEPLQFIDLFAGAGGATRGFLARPRWPDTAAYAAVAAVDIDRSATATYSYNFPITPVVRADLAALGHEDIRGLLRRFGLRSGRLDVLVACPPCQSYSRNNRARTVDDDRNWLYHPVIDWVRMARPKAVVIENVAELRDTDNGAHDFAIRSLLDDLNYKTDAWNLNAVYYGVPQHRTRRFYLAYRGDLGIAPSCPTATHHPADSLLSPSWITASQALDDLPLLRESGEGQALFTSKVDLDRPSFRRRYGDYAWMMRAEKGTKVSHHWTPPLSAIALRRLMALAPGQALADLPERLQPKMGFRGAYGRIHPQRPAWTITANCDYPSRGRFSHYALLRGISMREAARLQSFPDEFHFCGPREHVARQIGNGVPPLLMRAFANEIGRALGSAIL